MERTIVLGLAVAFVAFLAFLTFSMVADSGFGVQAVVGLVVLALVAVGVWGALGSPPDE